ncbi:MULTISPECIES: hypothetical protein [unclassified Paenibacillus]|uniref:hypothetical protein n=1 Tax=unclassified Paenibacillus TaxID=185978 RepID=UPI0024062F02|nr:MULTISPECIES: hypothetical protein [unclassified Paenibacillus]MDF9845563.1 hypothetical protein [Paenibacillus sp. PastF-2]MDF9852133.1 hypothetical protein [Paenibacillus sp. PastM-2]MDF9858713.1 hypothetical protein [Paenibacillus sp. PastF-1]MDH6483969.1 hypothetical protein [Paenibacillus sp. PastH-2]MDH6511353.1 hypothetical protein [Paenibacillus sp. PastM-3]
MSNKNDKKEENKIDATSLDVSAEENSILQEPAAEVAERVTPLIYLGPNLPAGRLLQSTVFRGGIPAYLEPLLVEQPDVAALIVPVDEMSSAQARIVQAGTPEYVAYQAILRGGPVNGI